eukprot:g4097.t1
MEAPATDAEAGSAEPQPTQESGTAGAVGVQVEKEVGEETGPADGTSSDSIKVEGLAGEHGGRGASVPQGHQSAEPNGSDRALRLLLFTWNVGNAKPIEDELELWLPKDGGDFDIVVVGCQECAYKDSATPRGRPKRHSLAGSDAIPADVVHGALAEITHHLAPTTSTKRTSSKLEEASFSFHWDDMVAARLGDGFVRVQQAVLMEMRLNVFCRQEMCVGEHPRVHSVETTYSATGLLHAVGNKGGLVVSMNVDNTSLCFISAHLAAHLKHLDKRNSDVKEILKETWPIGHRSFDIATQFDHCFWMGDLNYRVDLNDGSGYEKGAFSTHESHHEAVSMLIEEGNLAELMAHDQLIASREKGLAWCGFVEGISNFAPTFKVERKAGVTHIAQRIPSFCDRVLWKSMPQLRENVVQTHLCSIPGVSTSDHKPVVAHFQVRPRKHHSYFDQQSPSSVADANARAFPVVRFREVSGHDLIISDLTTKSSDPYLSIHVGPLKDESKGKVSAVKSRTTNPVWKESELPVLRPPVTSAEELSELCILISIFDHDLIEVDDHLGSIIVPFPDSSNSECKDGIYRQEFEEPVVLHSATADCGILKGIVEVDWNVSEDTSDEGFVGEDQHGCKCALM